ncbi:YihY/virulence factor BrkB family protein [Reichenbachiella agarivorans]|uniref:YihY/virulence factor BrkB family protein n=1 Tax=Reichenbachiella agarivorans TaxID=2979464 RepID=A0ABY6CRG1_9BACT|nr:YihY/virulence factor BrkB family protein [Reichenbachiella agarivorans]UXP31948.1 YihY/virulence factor BrkB family protein [Reichenbachiella agarivorans]
MTRQALHKRLLRYPRYKRFIKILKTTRLNKRRTTLYRAIVIFLDSILDNRLLTMASGVAFSFTLAIFPLIIFIFTLIPYIHTISPHIDANSIMSFIANVMPANMYQAANDTIHDIVSNKREGLLSFGVFFALLLATNGMHGLMSAFNSIYKTIDRRGFLKTRMIATMLTLMMAFVLFFSIFMLVIGKAFLSHLSNTGFFRQEYIYHLIITLKYGVIGVSFFIAISLIYYFAPAIHDRWTFFSAGTIFSAVSCVAVSYAFSFYINNFSAYNKFYGSLGMLIALMIWLYLLSIILLVGFEYNASVDKAVHSDKIEVTTSVFE